MKLIEKNLIGLIVIENIENEKIYRLNTSFREIIGSIHNQENILTKEKFENILKTYQKIFRQMMPSDYNKITTFNATTKNEFWLRSIVKCSDCGKSLVRCSVKGKPVPFFQCTGFTKGICRDSHYIRQDQLVPAILEQIKKDFTDKLNIKITEGTDTPQYDQIKLVKKNLEKLKTKRE